MLLHGSVPTYGGYLFGAPRSFGCINNLLAQERKKRMSDSTVASNEAEINWAFPVVDPGAKPLGGRILVQLRRTKTRTTSAGIILVSETKETEKWQNMVAKVIEIGPLAFKNRDTMQGWPEGSWCEVGDYIRVPKWVVTDGK